MHSFLTEMTHRCNVTLISIKLQLYALMLCRPPQALASLSLRFYCRWIFYATALRFLIFSLAVAILLLCCMPNVFVRCMCICGFCCILFSYHLFTCMDMHLYFKNTKHLLKSSTIKKMYIDYHIFMRWCMWCLKMNKKHWC